MMKRWTLRIGLLVLWLALGEGTAVAEDLGQWVVVAPPGLVDSARPLAARRKAEGWNVTIMAVEADVNAAGLASRLKAVVTEPNSCVLLLGSWSGDAKARLPSARGRHGRMKGVRTDHAYGRPDEKEALQLPVGRLPARSAEEATMMIEKLIRFESWEPAENRIHLIVADPGGRTKWERTLAGNVVKNAVDQRWKKLGDTWKPKCIMDIPGSEFTVASDKFGQEIHRLFAEPYTINLYSGHSNAVGFFSTAGCVLNRKAFAKAPDIEPGSGSDENANLMAPPGLFMSCGCYSCQVTGLRGQGYGLHAIRGPTGPSCVIGAIAESYAAFGLLAFDGLLKDAALEPGKPVRVGRLWLSVQNALVKQEMAQSSFLLFDMADGSGGKVPMEKQRLEHAEMWVLLGDPAMKLPLVAKSKSAVSVGSQVK